MHWILTPIASHAIFGWLRGTHGWTMGMCVVLVPNRIHVKRKSGVLHDCRCVAVAIDVTLIGHDLESVASCMRSKEEDSNQYINSFFSFLFFGIFSVCFLLSHFCCNLILKSRLTGVTSINWFYPFTAMATTRCVRSFDSAYLFLTFFLSPHFFFAFDSSCSQFVLFGVYCLKHACELSLSTWTHHRTYVSMSNLLRSQCSHSSRCYYWF